MDIGSLSMAMSQSSLNTAVQLSVLKLGMNSSEELMNNMQEMMEDVVVDPNVGQNLDITV
ncbi:YjfB family protein [Clostridium bornimense]|nr:YjfB family protein [Clostridium bornimense]